MDGVLILIIEVASTLFTHGPLGGFLSPTVLASSNSNYLLEENMAYWINARLWAEISWSDNTSRDLQFARVQFTALLYAKFFQQILALHHDLFKHCYTELLMAQKAWLCGHFDPEQAQLKIYLRLDDHTMWLATAKSRLSCSTQVRCYSSVIKRLQFNCPHISGTTYINMWALLCKVSIVCMWKNGGHPPLQSLSNL